jgi:hypothetical protein
MHINGNLEMKHPESSVKLAAGLLDACSQFGGYMKEIEWDDSEDEDKCVRYDLFLDHKCARCGLFLVICQAFNLVFFLPIHISPSFAAERRVYKVTTYLSCAVLWYTVPFTLRCDVMLTS